MERARRRRAAVKETPGEMKMLSDEAASVQEDNEGVHGLLWSVCLIMENC